jgi:hypothetical protein
VGLRGVLPEPLTAQVERLPAGSYVHSTGNADDDLLQALAKLRRDARAALAVDASPNVGGTFACSQPCICKCSQSLCASDVPTRTSSEHMPECEPSASVNATGGAGVESGAPSAPTESHEFLEDTLIVKRVRTRSANSVLPRSVRCLNSLTHSLPQLPSMQSPRAFVLSQPIRLRLVMIQPFAFLHSGY